MTTLEGFCLAFALSLTRSLACGARPADVWIELTQLAEVHGDLCIVGGNRWLA